MLTMLVLALGLAFDPPAAAQAGPAVPPRLEQNKPVPSCAAGTASGLFSTLHQAKATDKDVPAPSGVSDAEARKAIQRLASPKPALREEGLRMLRTFTTPEGQWAIYHASRGADGPIKMQVRLAKPGSPGSRSTTAMPRSATKPPSASSSHLRTRHSRCLTAPCAAQTTWS
jgi:hypothetical protein